MKSREGAKRLSEGTLDEGGGGANWLGPRLIGSFPR